MKNNICNEIESIFNKSLKIVRTNSTSHLIKLKTNNLFTRIICNHKYYSENLLKLSKELNKIPQDAFSSKTVDVYILENNLIFYQIDLIFKKIVTLNTHIIKEFNIATRNISKAKYTLDGRFYMIKCYDYLYYIYDTKADHCLIITTKNKKALTMINILLLAPYLLFGDLYAIHGNLVTKNKSSILLTGPSLSGKTTFSLLFLENRWHLITEETTYITKYGKVLNYNIRNYFNIRPGTYIEFKKLFIKMGVINKKLLKMATIPSEKLFSFGKRDQISVDLEDLCKKNNQNRIDEITYALKLKLKKGKGLKIKKINRMKIIDDFLKISFSPTVIIFKEILNIPNLKINKKIRRNNLKKMLKNIKSYSVISGIDYKKNFNLLLKKLKIKN